jgi:PAS domain S-box-containing protein
VPDDGRVHVVYVEESSVMARDATAPERSEGHFRDLVESAPDAIVVVDDRGKITLINAQTELLFGYTREELLGELVETLVPDSFRGKHPAHRGSYIANPRVRPVMEWIIAHGGKPETTLSAAPRRGLHGLRLTDSGGTESRPSLRFVLPAGALV